MKKQVSSSISIFAQIEKEVPKILAKVSKSSSDFLTNEQSQKNALVVAYDFLPLVIRLVVSEDTFVKFCMEHKEKFFGKPKTISKKTTVKTSVSIKKIIPKKATTIAKKTVATPKKAEKPISKTVSKPLVSKIGVTKSKSATIAPKKIAISKK